MSFFLAIETKSPTPEVDLAFALPIKPTFSDDATGKIIAFVSEDLPESMISRDLARLFGADKEGDVIHLVIEQYCERTDKINRFDALPFTVKFAPQEYGTDFLQWSLEDLEPYFQFYMCTPEEGNPKPAMILLQPRPDYRTALHQEDTP